MDRFRDTEDEGLNWLDIVRRKRLTGARSLVKGNGRWLKKPFNHRLGVKKDLTMVLTATLNPQDGGIIKELENETSLLELGESRKSCANSEKGERKDV